MLACSDEQGPQTELKPRDLKAPINTLRPLAVDLSRAVPAGGVAYWSRGCGNALQGVGDRSPERGLLQHEGGNVPASHPPQLAARPVARLRTQRSHTTSASRRLRCLVLPSVQVCMPCPASRALAYDTCVKCESFAVQAALLLVTAWCCSLGKRHLHTASHLTFSSDLNLAKPLTVKPAPLLLFYISQSYITTIRQHMCHKCPLMRQLGID